uniref:Transmembrane emp24 domain-containing protein 11-like n=1 Tax=Sphaeramia orbicularis TaxID=375764 RepID=A0A672Z116_9TELE
MGLRATAFLLQTYLILAAAMYFDLGEQEEKCIIEEIPEDMLVTGYFLLEPWDVKAFSHSPHLGVTVTIRDPNHEVVTTKRYGKFGKVTFTAHASGQHYLCFQTNSTRFSVFAKERLEKEETFREISEDTNSKVLWWAVVQTSILLSVGFWQMKRLKDFFIAKKLV